MTSTARGTLRRKNAVTKRPKSLDDTATIAVFLIVDNTEQILRHPMFLVFVKSFEKSEDLVRRSFERVGLMSLVFNDFKLKRVIRFLRASQVG